MERDLGRAKVQHRVGAGSVAFLFDQHPADETVDDEFGNASAGALIAGQLSARHAVVASLRGDA